MPLPISTPVPQSVPGQSVHDLQLLLDHAKAKLRTLETDKLATEKKNIKLTDEKSAIESALKVKTNEFTDQTAKLETKEKELNKFIATKNAINSTDRPTIPEKTKKLTTQTAKKITKYFNKLEQEKSDLQTQLTEANKKLKTSTAPDPTEVTKIQEELKEKTKAFELLQKEHDDLTKIQAELKKTNKLLTATSLKYTDQQKKIDTLTENLDTLSVKNKEIQKYYTSAIIEQNNLISAKDKAVEDYNDLSKDLKEKAEIIYTLRKENQRLHEKNEDQYVEVDGVKEDGFDNEE
jgi:chromosome segregation ATPase